jgi:hypothetical protein
MSAGTKGPSALASIMASRCSTEPPLLLRAAGSIRSASALDDATSEKAATS